MIIIVVKKIETSYTNHSLKRSYDPIGLVFDL